MPDLFEDGELLLIPGPVSVTKEVLAALARPVPAHYGPEWVEFYRLRAAYGQGASGIDDVTTGTTTFTSSTPSAAR